MSKSGHIVLGLLDKKTRLVADSHCFIMQEIVNTKDGDIWVGKYFYSQLGDVIRGYIKRKARKAGKTVISSKPLLDIIDLIASLEKTVKEVGESLEKQFAEIKNDPIEKSIKESENR